MTRIMVVDDDPEFTALYKASLTLMGYEAVLENHSSRAMELAYDARPDIIILDLMMPEPDGFQLTRMLRADPEFALTPILIITALNNEDSRIVAMGSGATDFLSKPFHIDELKRRLKFLLFTIDTPK